MIKDLVHESRRMTIDNETRARVYYLGKVQGLSTRKVAKLTGASQATVWRICNKKSRPQSNQNKGTAKKGRPRKLTPRHERLLLRVLTNLRHTEGRFSIGRLMEQSGLTRSEVSRQTIARFLHSKGYFYLQARKKGLMSWTDRRKRVAFARYVQRLYPDDLWTNVIAFYLDGTGFVYKRNPLDQARAPKGRIWRKKCEGLEPGCTAKGSKAGTGGKVLKIMVAISYGKGVIVAEPYEKMNGDYFANFIERNFDRMFERANKDVRRLWLQDGDPCQNSKIAKTAMQTKNAELLKLPPRSPDLNPIENLFNNVGQRLKEDALKRQISHESFHEFTIRVLNTLFAIDIETIDNLISSMNKRIKGVIKKRGKRLKY